MTHLSALPEKSYGVLQQDQFSSEHHEVAEQVRRIGYALLDSGFTKEELNEITKAFEQTREKYVATWGEQALRDADEFHTMRALLTHGGAKFLQLAMNPNLMAVLKLLISGKFILNQQNGVINPPMESYNQGAWHRDLPYQHYVSSSPLAVNALFCIDDFTIENGSTFVVPASHKAIPFPSASYLRNNALQVEAKAGQYILLDCMLFHSGGFNKTNKERRAINHVYTIPYFKQQINLPRNMNTQELSPEEQEIIGAKYQEPGSIENYLTSRFNKKTM
jgi:ectoine hydroxylase-related dioxygenase (phytanoyl-CoA dioxygenase family)